MQKSRLLTSVSSFADEFERCCREYETLNIATAWCGNPNHTLPYALIKNFTGTVKAIVGVAFNHTHPDAFEWFRKCGADIRVFRDDSDLFHPKVYLFQKGNRYALFVGSSNLTYGGFYANCEANVLIEGSVSTETEEDITLLEELLAEWRTPAYSLEPTGNLGCLAMAQVKNRLAFRTYYLALAHRKRFRDLTNYKPSLLTSAWRA